MLSSALHCAECGKPIHGTAGLGLCLACALQGAADLITKAGDGQARAAGGGRFGDYELLEEIARGGMGVVYRARQRSLGRIVALKILLGGAFAGPDGRRRLHAEAAAAGRLQHRNIVSVHEGGELDGQPFYSMDFVEGPTLAEISHAGPMTAKRAARYAMIIAESVQYAHSQGVLHRDLKPSNVLIDEFDQPRVTDFGLARVFASPGTALSQSDLTHTGQVLGSPAYMPPEQAAGRSKQIGPASDVYSLGAILYELLGGRPPFQGETPQAVIEQVKTVEPVPPHQLNGSVPVDLETICLKCLEKEPSARYPSAGELAEDLNRFLRGEPTLARPVSRLEKGWRWARRNPVLATMGLVSIGLLVAVAIVASVSAVRIRHSRDEAQARLADSFVSEARALRIAGEGGHREATLGLINNALELDFSGRLRQRLRREAIASLARPDIRRVAVTNLPLCHDLMLMCFDSTFERCMLWIEEEKSVQIFRVADGSRLKKITTGRPDETVMFSPDGRFILLRFGSKVALYGVETGASALEIGESEGSGGYNSGAFSLNGNFFGRGESGGRFVIYELPKEPTVRAVRVRDWLMPRKSRIRSVAWSSEGDAVAITSDDQHISVCDAETGRVRWESQHAAGPSWAVVWNGPLQLIAAQAQSDMIQTFQSGDGTEALRINTPNDPSASVAFSPDGLLLAGSTERFGIRLFNTFTGRPLFTDPAPSWHLHFDSTGRKLGTLFEKSRPAWLEWISSPVLELLRSRTSSANNQMLSFSAEGRWLSSLSLEGPILWDVSRRQKAAVVNVPNALYTAFDGDGEHVWVNTAASCMRVNIKTGESVKMATGTGFWGVATSPKFVAVADHKGKSIQILDRKGQLVRKLGPLILPAYVQFSPDGRWLACAADRDVYVWEVAALDRPPRQLPGEEPDPRFSPDGQWLLTPGRMPRLWRTGTWEEGPALPLVADASSVSLAAFSPDGRWLAVTQQNREIHLIDFATRQTLGIFEGPGESRIVAIEFSPNGKFLAAARDRGEVQLWDIPALRTELAKLKLDW